MGESQDGNYFVAEINYGEMAEMVWWWDSLKNISEIPEQNIPVLRGNNCKKLQFAPFLKNPPGQVIECIFAELPDSDYGERSMSYFALMSDGNVFLWRNDGGIFSMFVVLIFICIWIVRIPLTIGAAISAIYLTYYGIKHIRRSAG